MTIEKKENVYVQPDSKVYQVKLQQVIATSSVSSQSNDGEPDDFGYGGTL